jgi:hypothetical protein
MADGNRILAIITTLNEDPSETINSICYQHEKINVVVAVGSKPLFTCLSKTIRPDIEIILVPPDLTQTIGVRLGMAINAVLKKKDVSVFKYILKIDADVILPKNFIYANMKSGADLTGRFGFCMLLRVSSFVKLLEGKWPEVTTEDTYLEHLYSSQGYVVTDFILPPIIKRRAGSHYSWLSQYERGISWYKLGYEPFHAIIGSVIDFRSNPRILFAFFGYATASIKRTKRYSFAVWLFRKQLKQLLDIKDLASSVRKNVLPFL